MKSFNELLKEQPDLYFLRAADEDEVKAAEDELGLKFAQEYRQYLLEYGLASADGHEFTGIANSKRLNVVDATKELRIKIQNIPNGFYLIEALQIDGILIWQSSDGSIYQTVRDGEPVKISESLSDYFEQ